MLWFFASTLSMLLGTFFAKSHSFEMNIGVIGNLLRSAARYPNYLDYVSALVFS
jgi:hypothetical protein